MNSQRCHADGRVALGNAEPRPALTPAPSRSRLRVGVPRSIASALIAAIVLVTGADVRASLVHEATYTSSIQNGWVKVERWRDTRAGFTQETFPPDGRGDQSGQRVRFFGGDPTPHSSRFLLYYAPGWNSNPRATPVLLVHGANQDADHAWADPNEAGDYGCGRASCPSSGLMQQLDAEGFKVFAVSFPHKNGDGYYASSYFPGSAQMLKRWDGTYPLATFEQDWWTTYYGGWGYYTHSDGIDAVLGASLVDAVRSAGIPAGVWTHNLCGNQPDIALLHNEHTGPSDGVLFTASCTDTTGIATHGGSAVVAVNHLELGWAAAAVNQIAAWLEAP